MCTQFMRHGVVNAKESVGKRHTGQTGSICHTFFFIHSICTFSNRCFQIFKNKANCFNGKWVGVFGCHNGNIGFNGVRQNVNTRGSCQSFRHGQHEFRVNNGYTWGEFIVCKRVFDVSLFVSNNGKWRYF